MFILFLNIFLLTFLIMFTILQLMLVHYIRYYEGKFLTRREKFLMKLCEDDNPAKKIPLSHFITMPIKKILYY